MKNVLVCGASGFIGRNMAQRLAAAGKCRLFGAHFRRSAPPIPGMTPLRVDLTRAEDVRRALEGMDVVIQAAATTSGAGDILSSPAMHVTDNAVMNSLLFRAAHDLGVGHVVFFSCTIMYPSTETLLKEGDFDAARPMQPQYFGAGWTKVYLEKMCEFFAGLGRTRFTCLRHSNIYGPHDKYDLSHSHMFGATMTKVLTAKDGRIVMWGPGTERRDLLYVQDLVDCVELALECQTSPFELLNVGSGRAVAVKDVAAMIIAQAGLEISIEHDLSRPHIPTALALDCSLAAERLGWRPRTSLEEGIGLTLDWYRANLLSQERS